MKITRSDVDHAARLARLRFSDEQLELFTGQLNDILAYFDKLQQLDTTGVEPSSHAVNLCNAFREDKIKKSIADTEAIKNAPESERSLFKVPRVIEG